MSSRDDATRAAVAPLLADLRGDLLVMPHEAVVEQHLEMMTLRSDGPRDAALRQASRAAAPAAPSPACADRVHLARSRRS